MASLVRYSMSRRVPGLRLGRKTHCGGSKRVRTYRNLNDVGEVAGLSKNPVVTCLTFRQASMRRLDKRNEGLTVALQTVETGGGAFANS